MMAVNVYHACIVGIFTTRLRVCLCVDQGALKITLLVQHLGARWRASAIARLKSEPLYVFNDMKDR